MFLVGASVAVAHDTWLRSEAGTVASGAVVTLHLTSGDGFAADDFAIDRNRLRDAAIRLGASRLPLTAIGDGARPGGSGALLLRATLGKNVLDLLLLCCVKAVYVIC